MIAPKIVSPARMRMLLSITCLLAGLLAGWGCTSPGRHIRAIHEDERNRVTLVARGGDRTGSFAHPLSFSEADWDIIFQGIRVQPKKRLLPSIGADQAGPREAFREGERQYLAQQLGQAFAQAGPDQWVAFSLSRPREEASDVRGGPGVTEVTSGGFFVQGAKLHLLLANYRFTVTVMGVLEKIRKDPLRPAGDAFYQLVASRHQTVQVDEESALTRPFRSQVPELIIDYKASLAQSSPKNEEAAEPESQKPRALEERLRTLQRLREQGLITEEEYRLKRQKLLDEL